MRLLSSTLVSAAVLGLVVVFPYGSHAWSSPFNIVSSVKLAERSSSSASSSLLSCIAKDIRIQQQQQQKRPQNLPTMTATSLTSSTPTMFLNHKFSPTAALTSSPFIRLERRSRTPNRNMDTRKKTLPGSSNEKEQRGVLGFDIFSLEARPSNVDLDTWNSADSYNRGGQRDMTEPSFFPAPGLAWNSNAPSSTSTTTARSLSLRFLTHTLPAWFPWIATKSQIDSLKLTELKEACAQRGLTKSGNKLALQQRLWSWTTDHQHQHQARLTGDVIRNWFEVEDSPAIKFQTNDTANAATTTVDPQSPNSLAEWARTVDLEPLLQKRKAIHRQKRQGQPSPKKTFKKPKQSQKDYLLNLSKTLQTPSSPYSSNVEVKELYLASKEADQLGDRQLAIKLLETLLQLTPNDARIYRRLARMFSEQGHLDRARATLQQGLRRMPDNPWLWHGMATLELTHGCAKHQARRFFQKAIRVDPTFAHSYHALGTLEHNQGNIAQSMKILKQGIDYCPTNHRLHHALGDLYRGAKLLEDAKRSYRRALEHGPPVSHCFAYSSLASVAYEQTQPDEARRWLQKSLQVNNGRHAQGWIALAQLEEAEDNTEKARLVCMAAIAKYERGLIEMRQRYKNNRHYNNLEEKKSVMKPILTSLTNPLDVKNLLLAKVPRYRSGDKFLKVYRNWARLEERYGSFDSVDQVYDRASLAFPLEYKLTLDWARFHATMRNHDRARSLFMEACTKASSRHADPYRVYAEHEMSIGKYGQARKILFRGAQAVSQSSDGGLGNRRGLAELFHTWAICEWHLNNLPRAEVLFDHALRLTEAGEEGSQLRSFILYSIARLEHYRGELHLAQHCVGLCLKENRMPGGNAAAWELWTEIAKGMENPLLEKECRVQAERAREQEDGQLLRLSPTGSASERPSMKGSDVEHLMRREPWQYKLFGSSGKRSSDFYSNVRFPQSEKAVAQSSDQ